MRNLLVTPFVGVWIETWSHYYCLSWYHVTPFVGVWIETYLGKLGKYYGSLVTPFVGVWIETSVALQKSQEVVRSHPSWVCGLKLSSKRLRTLLLCHTLRGCVDWNMPSVVYILSMTSHTLRGCVDWNPYRSVIKDFPRRSHPSWVCGLKLHIGLRLNKPLLSHPSWVCGLKHVISRT